MATQSRGRMPISSRPRATRRTRSASSACEIGSKRPCRFTWSASGFWNFATASKNSLLRVPGAELRGPPDVCTAASTVVRESEYTPERGSAERLRSGRAAGAYPELDRYHEVNRRTGKRCALVANRRVNRNRIALGPCLQRIVGQLLVSQRYATA